MGENGKPSQPWRVDWGKLSWVGRVGLLSWVGLNSVCWWCGHGHRLANKDMDWVNINVDRQTRTLVNQHNADADAYLQKPPTAVQWGLPPIVIEWGWRGEGTRGGERCCSATNWLKIVENAQKSSTMISAVTLGRAGLKMSVIKWGKCLR